MNSRHVTEYEFYGGENLPKALRDAAAFIEQLENPDYPSSVHAEEDGEQGWFVYVTVQQLWQRTQ